MNRPDTGPDALVDTPTPAEAKRRSAQRGGIGKIRYQNSLAPARSFKTSNACFIHASSQFYLTLTIFCLLHLFSRLEKWASFIIFCHFLGLLGPSFSYTWLFSFPTSFYLLFIFLELLANNLWLRIKHHPCKDFFVIW